MPIFTVLPLAAVDPDPVLDVEVVDEVLVQAVKAAAKARAPAARKRVERISTTPGPGANRP
jgi:hypothetical protein